jgi:hypothetical protein
MKKLLIALITLILVSCEDYKPTFSQTVNFSVIGDGMLSVTQMYNNNYSVNETTAYQWTRTFSSGESYYVSAQSKNGTGCKIQAFVNGQLFKESSSNGYGVASISIHY